MGCNCSSRNTENKVNIKISDFWKQMKIRHQGSEDILKILKPKIGNEREISKEKWNSIIGKILVNETDDNSKKISEDLWKRMVQKAKDEKKECCLFLSLLLLSKSTKAGLIITFSSMCFFCQITEEKDLIDKGFLKDFLVYYFELLTDTKVIESLFGEEKVDLYLDDRNLNIQSVSTKMIENVGSETEKISINDFFEHHFSLIYNDDNIRNLVFVPKEAIKDSYNKIL